MTPPLPARSKPAAIVYRIEPVHPEAHLFEIVLRIESPDPQGQQLSLPVWIPGSYLVREFAKHVVSIAALETRRNAAIGLRKIDKNTWLADPCKGPITVTYRVYAWDPSVRAAHLDQTHGFFNGTSVFLRVHGCEGLEHRVRIVAPSGKMFADWRVATGLPRHDAKRHGFGTYRADNYDALVDHPVEMGHFRLGRFSACGVPHEIAVSGRVPNLDLERVCGDLKRICEAQIALFEPKSLAAPFSRYLFLLTVLEEGYGGLEHRNSTALLCSRDALPSTSNTVPGESYATFLGLASHEYFHSWNVKRIKPQRFAPYDFNQENYTSLLWIFEGFTSYYDDLVLVRTGLLSEERYFETLARVITDVQNGSGRLKQSVAESSFDAWIKYYRPDENTPNAVVSYYKKGSLIGLALDLMIRATTAGQRSLDDVMRLLWDRYGRHFYPDNVHGLEEDEFASLVLESTGVDVRREVRHWAYGTVELPLVALLKPFGLTLQARGSTRKRRDHDSGTPVLGARIATEQGAARIAAVSDGSAAQLCGLSAGDILVAMDGLRVTAANLDQLLGRYAIGQSVVIHAFRRDELRQFHTRLQGAAPLQWQLSAETGRQRLRQGWLRQA